MAPSSFHQNFQGVHVDWWHGSGRERQVLGHVEQGSKTAMPQRAGPKVDGMGSWPSLALASKDGLDKALGGPAVG
jgi:hypothetical protein